MTHHAVCPPRCSTPGLLFAIKRRCILSCPLPASRVFSQPPLPAMRSHELVGASSATVTPRRTGPDVTDARRSPLGRLVPTVTNLPGSEEPRRQTPACLRPPRRRLTTPGRWPVSEDPDLELPTRSDAPKSTRSRRRETAPRPQRDRRHPATRRRTPRGTTPRHVGRQSNPSRDPPSDPSTSR
jgi:hypothetical protein